MFNRTQRYLQAIRFYVLHSAFVLFQRLYNFCAVSNIFSLMELVSSSRVPFLSHRAGSISIWSRAPEPVNLETKLNAGSSRVKKPAINFTAGLTSEPAYSAKRDSQDEIEVEILKQGKRLEILKQGVVPGGRNSLHVFVDESKERDSKVALLEKSSAPDLVRTDRLPVAATVGKINKPNAKWLMDQVRGLLQPEKGPPRWFCPLGSGGFSENSPLLLCLPGLLKIVEAAIQNEVVNRPGSPIYLMGESFGGLLALSVAARNPELDLVLILADPATWCDGYQVMSPFLSLLEAAPGRVSSVLPFLLSLTLGDPVTIAKATVDPSLPPWERTQQFASALQELLRILSTATVEWSKEMCQWKLKHLQQGARTTNWQLHTVKCEVLLLARTAAVEMHLNSFSTKQLPERNANEAKRLKQVLGPKCTVRFFKDSGPALLLEEGVQLASLIKATNIYRRSRHRDVVRDYFPPSEDEVEMFRKVHIGIMKQLFSPICFSVEEKGTVARGLPRVTKDRPILFICNHTFVGFDLGVILNEFLESQNVIVRSLAHPLVTRDPEEELPASGLPDLARLLGAVPVTGNNLYRLMAARKPVLLLPGGMREAVKRKGEAYKLFWPKKPEFVRTAIRHGATIIPIAAVGGDDFIQLLLDQDEVMKLPVIGERLRSLGANMPRVRPAEDFFLGSLGFPTPPPRMYFLFQKPIYTHEFPETLKDKKIVGDLYQQVKSELEDGLAYLVKKRNEDPYQKFVPRLIYESTFGQQAPTFKPGHIYSDKFFS